MLNGMHDTVIIPFNYLPILLGEMITTSCITPKKKEKKAVFFKLGLFEKPLLFYNLLFCLVFWQQSLRKMFKATLNLVMLWTLQNQLYALTIQQLVQYWKLKKKKTAIYK